MQKNKEFKLIRGAFERVRGLLKKDKFPSWNEKDHVMK